VNKLQLHASNCAAKYASEKCHNSRKRSRFSSEPKGSPAVVFIKARPKGKFRKNWKSSSSSSGKRWAKVFVCLRALKLTKKAASAGVPNM